MKKALRFTVLLWLAVAVLNPALAFGAEYPNGPITIIIPTSAGGGYDLGARLIAKHLPKYLPNNVTVVPDNRSGGAQMIGVHSLYGSKNDGYTIGIFNLVGALLAPYTRGEGIEFEIDKFEYLGLWQTDIRAIGVNKQVTAKTWDELVAMGKEKPIVAGTGGLGVGQHTDIVVLSALSGVPFKYVHYDGSAPVEPALGRGEIQFEMAQTGTIRSVEEEGMGRAFCVFNDTRDPVAPDIPTALEVGMPKDLYDNITSLPFFGVQRVVAAPPGTDPAIVKILRDAIWKVFQDSDYIADQEKIGGTNNPIDGETLQKQIAEKVTAINNYPELVNALKNLN
jgi:tripartite-type tricarboxylate transporter receptor subunit TctC